MHGERIGARSILLVGFMGAGKSTVGRALAARLNCEFEDLDQRIEQRAGRTVPEIFRDLSEPQFRRMERAALRESLAELAAGAERIVALGGGAFAPAKNLELIAASGVHTVFLDAPVEELWRRCCEQATGPATERPLLGSFNAFRRLHGVRQSRYLKAQLRQPTGGRAIDAIVAEIVKALHLGKAGKGVR